MPAPGRLEAPVGAVMYVLTSEKPNETIDCPPGRSGVWLRQGVNSVGYHIHPMKWPLLFDETGVEHARS